MSEEPQDIDVSALAELVSLRRDEETLMERLQKMEASREKVSAIVYHRVKSDYETRRAALESRGRAPRERAGREYAKLRMRITEAEKAVEESLLEKQEVEFRHDLGEFGEDEFETRFKESDRRLTDRQEALARFLKLRDEFREAFHTMEDLEKAAATAPEAPRPPEPRIDAARSASVPRPPMPAPPPPPPPVEPRMDSTASASRPAPVPVPRPPMPPPAPAFSESPEATVVGMMPGRPGGGSDSPQATVITHIPVARPGMRHGEEKSDTYPIVFGRIIVLSEEKPQKEYVLQSDPATIGRAPDSTIHLPFTDVSRQHAAIQREGDRFKVVDRGSPNGVFVNAERVKERLLTDGDVIQVGRRKLLFKTTGA